MVLGELEVRGFKSHQAHTIFLCIGRKVVVHCALHPGASDGEMKRKAASRSSLEDAAAGKRIGVLLSLAEEAYLEGEPKLSADRKSVV